MTALEWDNFIEESGLKMSQFSGDGALVWYVHCNPDERAIIDALTIEQANAAALYWHLADEYLYDIEGLIRFDPGVPF